MIKILSLFVLATAILLLTGSKQYPWGEMAGDYMRPYSVKEVKDISKSGLQESIKKPEPISAKKALRGSPQILLMLNNGTGQSSWSPSLWWNYQPSGTGKAGC